MKDLGPGVRVPDGTSPLDFPVLGYGRCQWGQDPQGAPLEWSVRVPGEHAAARIPLHEVVEHEDGTITVSPSILVHPAGDRPGFHGYLQAGRWSDCDA